MKLRFSPVTFATIGAPIQTQTSSQDTLIHKTTINVFTEKDVEKILTEHKGQISELKLGEGLDIEVQYQDLTNFRINLSVNVQGMVMGVMYNSNFCRRFIYAENIDGSKQWENYSIRTFDMPLDRKELDDIFTIKTVGSKNDDTYVLLPTPKTYEVSYGAKLPSVTIKNGKIQEESIDVSDGKYILKRVD